MSNTLEKLTVHFGDEESSVKHYGSRIVQCNSATERYTDVTDNISKAINESMQKGFPCVYGSFVVGRNQGYPYDMSFDVNKKEDPDADAYEFSLEFYISNRPNEFIEIIKQKFQNKKFLSFKCIPVTRTKRYGNLEIPNSRLQIKFAVKGDFGAADIFDCFMSIVESNEELKTMYYSY